jgi:uncharacterized membrane protein YhaH (DUF805 family)
MATINRELMPPVDHEIAPTRAENCEASSAKIESPTAEFSQNAKGLEKSSAQFAEPETGGSLQSEAEGKVMTFSWGGRLSRGGYWKGVVVLTMLQLACVFLPIAFAPMVLSSVTPPEELGTVVMVAFWAIIGTTILCLAWISLGVQVKRWHDRNRSGWMVLFFIIPSVIIEVVTSIEPSPIGLAGALIAVVVALWCLFELGFRKGTRGSNTFGPDPCE